jgi:hypothetical protein
MKTLPQVISTPRITGLQHQDQLVLGLRVVDAALVTLVADDQPPRQLRNLV